MGHQARIVGRLVHISDIHFGHKVAPGLWTSLKECVKDLEPAAVLITGDIVNTPRRKQFEAAKTALAGLAPLVVRVCPGNHDRHFLGNALGGLRSPFGRDFFYYMSETYVPAPRFDMVKLGPKVKAVITAIDSSDKASYFARSFVDQLTLTSIKEAFLQPHPGVQANDLVLRVVLIHHHLLPISALEARNDVLLGPFSSATTLTVNAGTVLEGLAESGVDLVFHGHEHQRSIGRYTSLSDKEWAVTVVGAGSATGTDTKEGWSAARASFNVIDVCDDDSVWISEFFASQGESGKDSPGHGKDVRWSSRNRHQVLTGAALRRSRYARCQSHADGEGATLKTHYTFLENGDIQVHRVFSSERLGPDATYRFYAYSETGTPVEPEVWLQDQMGVRTFGYVEKHFEPLAEKLHTYECVARFPKETASTEQIVGSRYRWVGSAILKMSQILEIAEPSRSYLHRNRWENVYSKAPRSPTLLRSLEVSVDIPREWAPDDTQGNFAVFVMGPTDTHPHEHAGLSNRLYYNGDGLFALRVEYPDSETNYYICWHPREQAR